MTMKKLAFALACAVLACVALALGGRGLSAQVAPAIDVDRGFGLGPLPKATTPRVLKRSQTLGLGDTLQFLVLGDWGTGGQGQKDVAEAMARHAHAQARQIDREAAIDFVVLTGDNFYEHGVQGVDDPLWQERFETMYDPIRLPMPFIAVLGNHDWGNDPLAQIQYSASRPPILIDRGGARRSERPELTPGTRWEMDGFYFKRQFGRVGEGQEATALADFFFIDTDLWTLKLGALADKQMAWLQDGLKNSRARWQFVVAHHPLYSDGAHGREAEILALREKLSPLFARWGVDAFLCGHDHDLQHIEIPGHPTSFIVSGAGAKLRPRATPGFGPFYASTPGFVAITLSPDSMQAQVIDDKSQVLHKWQRSPSPPQP